MKTISYFFLFFLLCICACSNTNSSLASNRDKAIDKQKEASSIYCKIVLKQTEADSINVVLNLLNESIALDSTYSLAYSTKIQVLNSYGQYEEALKVIQLAIDRNLSETNPELIVGRGIQYDMLNQPEKALQDYQRAIELFHKQSEKDPDNYNSIATQEFLHFLMGEEERGIQNLKEILKKPLPAEERTSIEILLNTLQNNNKKEVIEQFKNKLSDN